MLLWMALAAVVAFVAYSYRDAASTIITSSNLTTTTSSGISSGSSSSSDPTALASQPAAAAKPAPVLITRETLAASQGEAPRLLLSIVGHVFDVSVGRSVYGQGGSYGFFAGTDATRSFATGDFENDLNDNVTGFSEEQCMSIEGWLKFYQESDKYHFVGYLQDSVFIHTDAASILRQLSAEYDDMGTSFTKTHTDIQSEMTAKLLALENLLTPAYTDLMACARRGHEEEEKLRNDAIKAPCNTQIDVRNKQQQIWCSQVTVEEKETGATKVIIRLPRRMIVTHMDGSMTEKCVCIPSETSPKRHDLHVYKGCDLYAEKCVVSM